MKARINILGILVILMILSVKANAQDKGSDFKLNEIRLLKHNDRIYEHTRIMLLEANKPENLFNKRTYLNSARKIKGHATKAKSYVLKLRREEKSVKNSEIKFNKIIEHYDKILQEEFQIEKELGKPTNDRDKLASHLARIINELDELKKKI